MSEKRRGLGRGIGALIPPAPSPSGATAAGRERPVDVFFPSRLLPTAPFHVKHRLSTVPRKTCWRSRERSSRSSRCGTSVRTPVSRARSSTPTR